MRYVYDCGSMTKYQTARTNRIKEYLRRTKRGARLDLLFISHVHADHLNGLPQLLDAKKGLKVDTIVMPYFNMIERLIAYGRDAIEDPLAVQDDFYRAFVVDPVGTVSEFGPRQILLVRSSGGDGPGAPTTIDGPDGPDLDIKGPIDPETGTIWKLVGSESRRSGGGQSGSAEKPVVATISDTVGIAVPDPAMSTITWLFSPFIDPAIARQHGVFKAALLKALNHGKPPKARIKKADFDKWLDNPANLKDLVLNKVGDLKQAYTAVEKNLNVSSMCLYSGPLANGQLHPQSHSARFGTWGYTEVEGSIGWLATGDADLKVKARRTAFLRHYGKLLHQVSTLTIPHHGSEGNFHEELLDKIEPRLCVAAADSFGKWRHPGTTVVQAIASRGRFLSLVTSAQASEVVEEAALG